MAKELLKEAIADAKAVREVALQNAKMALEEAFDSKIKSMLSAKLAEEIEEDVELEEEYIEEEAEATDEGMSYEEDDKDAANEEFDLEEDLDEEINLDELMAELEEMSDDVTEGDEVELEEGDLEESFFGNIAKKIKDTIGGPVGRAESAFIEKYKADFDKLAKAEKADDNDTLRTLQPKLKSALNSWLSGAYKEFGVDNSTDQKLLRDNLTDIITNVDPDDQRGMMQKLATGASAGRQKVSADMVGEGHESFDIDALVAEIEAEIEEGKNRKDDEMVDEAYGDSPGKATGPAKGKPGAPFGDGKSGKGGTGYDDGAKKLKEERDEALATVATLQETISEMNLLNSKLLYCNKLFRANALTEAQKVKVVDALDKATTTGEAKLVFETLQESFNFTGVEKRAIQEGLGRASKAAGTAPKKVITESVDETVSRFQKLANIKF